MKIDDKKLDGELISKPKFAGFDQQVDLLKEVI